MKTSKKARIEILVDAPFRRRLCTLIDEFGAPGYTVFPALAGRVGETVWERSGLISAVGKMEVLVCIIDSEQCDSLVTQLSGHMGAHIGYVAISDVTFVEPNGEGDKK